MLKECGLMNAASKFVEQILESFSFSGKLFVNIHNPRNLFFFYKSFVHAKSALFASE
ncbi:hypothetical protein DB44_AP00030 [Candidatus Protochlamydia amoebophila]|uniref:Uncharacterized protein n=1 Tax=Candidatus Protochlamydia amoebophila TaxID=362787 RepID=A0A0C1H9Y0_9BACT|nr:hypothetical protein DB44_AP00030 [Candidatus Protochlamydia amoebophila]